MSIPTTSIAAAIACALATVALAEPPEAAVRVQSTVLAPRHTPDDVVQPMLPAFRPGAALSEDLPQGPRPQKPVRSADDEVVRPLSAKPVRDLDLDDAGKPPARRAAARSSASQSAHDQYSGRSAAHSPADETSTASAAARKPARPTDPPVR